MFDGKFKVFILCFHSVEWMAAASFLELQNFSASAEAVGVVPVDEVFGEDVEAVPPSVDAESDDPQPTPNRTNGTIVIRRFMVARR